MKDEMSPGQRWKRETNLVMGGTMPSTGPPMIVFETMNQNASGNDHNNLAGAGALGNDTPRPRTHTTPSL